MYKTLTLFKFHEYLGEGGLIVCRYRVSDSVTKHLDGMNARNDGADVRIELLVSRLSCVLSGWR